MNKHRYYVGTTVISALWCIVAACADEPASPVPSRPMEQVLAEQAANMGANIIKIGASDAANRADVVTPQDAEDILKVCPAVRYVSSGVSLEAELEFRQIRWGLPLGVTPSYFVTNEWKIGQGKLLSDADIREHRDVCVIGSDVAKHLFGKGDAVGKIVSLVWTTTENRKPTDLRVIGVLEKKGPALGGSSTWNGVVLVPLTTANDKVSDGKGGLGGWGITAKAISRDRVPEAIKQITELLRKRHNIQPGKPDDFIIVDQNQVIDEWVKRAMEDEQWRNRKVEVPK
ncbi:MAG: ABC transporter permease [Planctomycetia bacterium]|nr:ABC transporter permease [Planctomycetia bacterium]